MLFGLGAIAQTPPYYNQIPTANPNGFPLNNNAATGKKCQYILLPGDFALPSAAPSGNNITSLWVYKLASTANTVTYTNLTIKFATVPSSTFFTTGSWYGGATTTALSQTTALTLGASAGWVEIVLTTPYLYDPSQSLLVEISQCGYTGTGFSFPQNSLGVSPNFRRQYSDASSVCGVTPLATGGDLNVPGFGISLTPAGPCVAPPTAGTSTASPSTTCFSTNVTLGLTGNSAGTGQTYQWQSSPTFAGPYTPIGAPSNTPSLITTASATQYYQCAVTCSGNTSLSTPVLLTVNPALPAGNYSINSTVPTGGTNYQTFADAVLALSCGIAGPVVF